MLLSNERTACFPADKWRFDKTDPHCSVALSEVILLLTHKLKRLILIRQILLPRVNYIYMGFPLWREINEKKKERTVSLFKVSASAYGRVFAYGNV